MRRQRRHPLIPAAALCAVALTGACAHNDVLVFGTSTTIGLNVETASTNGAAPSIVLGYEREEAVWMPLVLNGRDSKLDLCAADEEDCADNAVPVSEAMYRSVIITGEGVDRVEQRDTYSVFASLGAHFNGRATTDDGAEAGGGLAQFFATGNAAVNITRNPALVTALKVESGQGAEAQANAVRDVALSAAAAARVESARRDIDFVIDCTTTQGKDWATIVNASTLSDARKQRLATLAPASRRAAVEGDPERLAALAAAAQAAGCTR